MGGIKPYFFVEFLIDRKVWNKVIKKVSPKLGLLIKEGLEKNYHGDYQFKKNCVLELSNKEIYYGFSMSLFNLYSSFRYDLEKGLKRKKTNKNFLELERAVVEVLIETQGLSDAVKYDVFGKSEYIIEQEENLELIEKGFVYLIRNEDIYKIGITDNLLRRFNQLKPDEVLNVVRCSNYESLEKELHKKFKEYRIPQTEYFRLNKNQIEQVNIEMTKGAEF